MQATIFLYAFGVWVIFAILAIINGIIRNQFYAPRVGEYPGHVISTIIAICIVVAGTYIFLRFVKIDYSTVNLLLVGVFWLVLTVLFEFIFGHYVIGHPWERLLADYNILNGRLWGLFLLALLISPLLIGLLFRK